jgi:hypothetical protein
VVELLLTIPILRIFDVAKACEFYFGDLFSEPIGA